MKTTFPFLSVGLECTQILTYARAGQGDRARAELRALATDDFAHVLRTPSWLMNMAVLANACTAIGDVDVACELYRHLTPFTPYNVVLPPVLVLAPVAYYVGRLAVTMGNEAAARRHFEDAIALELRMGSRHCLALTQIAYGQLLLRSRNSTDAERGARLNTSGRALADELHLVPVVSQVNTLAAAPRPSAGVAVLQLVDDVWQIEFNGHCATLPHRVGMTYLRCLLERPGVPVPAIELASLGNETILVDRNGGPLVDRKAMAEVQHRLSEIDAEVTACKRRGAVVSTDLLHERAACTAYVGGRGSELVSAADRARSGVSKAIGRALKAIHGVHEGLGHHLERHVETGRLCVYIPDPAAPISFEF
jgi:hypothetical protein